jgi:hypothetical protein
LGRELITGVFLGGISITTAAERRSPEDKACDKGEKEKE